MPNPFLPPLYFASLSHCQTQTNRYRLCTVDRYKLSILMATGIWETHLLPEPEADLELTFCENDLRLIPGLFALMPCNCQSQLKSIL